MYIRPEDLANLCAIYAELGTSKIARFDLAKYIQTSMPIDSDFSTEELILTALEYDLINTQKEYYSVANKGRALSKRQKRTSHAMSESAKEYMLKNIYFSPKSLLNKCKYFLLNFQADTFHETFIYHRPRNENHEDINWLKILSQLDFLVIESRLVKIRKEYLGFFNDILLQLRRGEIKVSFETSPERIRVGEIAEDLAIEFEKKRLKNLGHKILCSFVQQISTIDMTAGYDIISFRGSGKHPEKKIFIEVKGTRKANIDFIWTSNERQVASILKKKYWIYAFAGINTKQETGKGHTRINNPISALKRKSYTIEAIDVHVYQ